MGIVHYKMDACEDVELCSFDGCFSRMEIGGV